MLVIAEGAWRPTTDPVTVVVGRLPLRSPRSALRVLVWTHRVRRAFSGEPGLMGYRVGYDVRASALWTVSAWATRTDLLHFERCDVHLRAMAGLRPYLRPSDFVVWTTDGGNIPPVWDEVRRRIRAVEDR